MALRVGIDHLHIEDSAEYALQVFRDCFEVCYETNCIACRKYHNYSEQAKAAQQLEDDLFKVALFDYSGLRNIKAKSLTLRATL